MAKTKAEAQPAGPTAAPAATMPPPLATRAEMQPRPMRTRLPAMGAMAASGLPSSAGVGSATPRAQQLGRLQRRVGNARINRLIQQQSAGASPATLPPSVNQALQSSSGQRLEEGTRAQLEPAFGSDFGAVRVHTTAGAAQAAHDINARAFTVGQDIYFGEGQYQPRSDHGQRLLAHELTHTIQQGGGGPARAPLSPNTAISQPADPLEHEADRVAAAVMRTPAPNQAGAAADSDGEQRKARPVVVSRTVIQRDGAPPSGDTAPPSANTTATNTTYTFEGLELSDSPEQVHSVLTAEVVKAGLSSIVGLPLRIEHFLQTTVERAKQDKRDVEAGMTLPAGVPWSDEELAKAEALRDQILPVVVTQVEALQQESDDAVREFESFAIEVAEAALEDSEQRVVAEAVRYGVGNLRVEIPWFSWPRIAGDVADNASTRGLAIAAEGLLTRKKRVDDARHEHQRFAGAMSSPSPEAARQRTGLQSHEVEIRLSELRGEINRTQRDLDIFRIQVQTRFPILAALSSDEDFRRSELEDLAKGSTGKSQDATKVIVDQIVEKLLNIDKVREGLEPGGDVNVWRVPKIVETTKAALAISPGTLRSRVVEDKIRNEQPSALTGIFIGILQLGLVLLAPLTEGLSLIPAAALGAATAYQHFKEYEMQSALHGTDFGAAALSAEEPSLFWLAVDIVGAGFDVAAAGGVALRMFRELAPAAKAVRTATVADDAIRRLETQARELGGEALARRVAEDARTLGRGAGREVGVTAEEARKFEQAAADVAAQELREGAQAAEPIAGRHVSVSRAGQLWSCSSPCVMMRERYKDLFAREPKYRQRLSELEGRAKQVPAGPEGDAARRQLANEATAFEHEMRTTSLPGDWTSPLKDSPEFDALVKKRGSVAADLDHHPPGWSGREEASFRYGTAAEPEPGYRWTIDQQGTLRYERLDASLPPRRFNPASGLFEEAGEEGLIRAVRGPEGTRELAKLSPQEREAMEAAFKKRRDLIAERDRLEALQEAGTIAPNDVEKLKKLYAQINEQSRQLGEVAAESVMQARGGKKIYPLGKTHSTSGDFDQVWRVGDEFHIVEAKGGSGALGSRAVGQGMRAEQGTIEYAKSIAENMANNGATKEIRQLGNELLAAIAQGKVKYVLVRAPIGTQAGVAVLGDVKVSEFIMH